MIAALILVYRTEVQFSISVSQLKNIVNNLTLVSYFLMIVGE